MSTEQGKINRRRRNEGRLDHPARAADRVKFPATFGKRFAVFIDTEEEFDWSQPRSRDATATSAIRYLPEFQRLMDAHDIYPTYMIDFPVADNQQAAETLSSMLGAGNCRVGTQLHAWVNPPYDEEIIPINSFAGNLPIELERAKLAALTERITTAVGVRPTIYRAGRYGIGPNSAALLEEAGYLVDVSVRPHFDYSNEGGPNFLRHNARPYWAGPSGNLLELPLGVSYTGQLRRYGRLLYGDGQSKGRRIAGLARAGMLARVALTPEDMPIDDVKRAIDTMLSDGHQFFSFSFHSPSLTPGHTPYVRNSADLTNFYGWWDKVLTFLAARKVTPASVDEVLAAAQSTRPAVA
ncbi:MAG: polysaccharide deacetylase family protein [Pseudomonadota bacterium]